VAVEVTAVLTEAGIPHSVTVLPVPCKTRV
jgi:hypothetical protein